MQTKDSFSSAKLLNKDFLSSFTNKKFDGIIMNPPYVRQEKIDNLSTLGVSKTLLRQNPLFSELPSTANLYMYFIVKAISLLAENGELIVIFPGSWLTARSGKQFEKVIYAKCSLIKQLVFFLLLITKCLNRLHLRSYLSQPNGRWGGWAEFQKFICKPVVGKKENTFQVTDIMPLVGGVGSVVRLPAACN